ncbi:MAG: FAD:protein FMN transferase [Lachnospiraceae bacterium]|nr:FAD:protein FMN transferase [Lachnospiraceae bacterium]
MTSSRKYKYLAILCLLICCLFAGYAANKSHNINTTPVTKTGFYFDTVIQITLYGTFDEQIFDNCFALCEQYETMLSRTLENSDVWNINHADGKPVIVSSETAYLLEKAVYYSTLTNGIVDATIAPLSNLWNFSATNPSVPSEADITSLLSHVNYKNITISKTDTTTTVSLSDPNASIDLGFIAKGYIADKLKEYLLSANIKSAIINLGGNVLTVGSKPDGSAFTIGIQQPFGDRNESAIALPVTDSSLVSSGIYERYFTTEDGTLYHHILDTKTGYPIQNNLFGVTILSASSTDGDALSTACFALGLEKGMALVESLEGIEAVFITNDNTLHYSSGLQP